MAVHDSGGSARGGSDPRALAEQWLAAHGITPPEEQVRSTSGSEQVRSTSGSEQVRSTSGSEQVRSTSRNEHGRSTSMEGHRVSRPHPGRLVEGQVQGAVSSPQEPDDEGDGDVDPVAVARRIVTRRLAARAHTRHELAEVLRKRRVPESAAQAVLDRMEELGLVDDVDFAQEWVSSRQRRRHLSAAALRRELQDRGVDRDTVDAALSGLDPDQELASARELIRRRSSTLRALAPEVRYRRLAGLLARRGYSSAVATRLLAEERDADDRGAEATTTRGPDLGDPRGTRGDGVIRRA